MDGRRVHIVILEIASKHPPHWFIVTHPCGGTELARKKGRMEQTFGIFTNVTKEVYKWHNDIQNAHFTGRH